MNYILKFDNKVINFIAKTVYNPDFWAREIRRYITDQIEDVIAEKVIMSSHVKDFTLTIEKNELIVQ
jgi:ATP-dependent Clp protease ATP-binding subunit ClpA